ncbi:oligosaccharide flippase family protein [Carnobacterium inhibens]|nr:oligosaccharide flippase family protein [Carnobacterium inhibens]
MINLRRNYIYNITYQFVLVLTPLIITPYLSRILGAEGIGIYSYHFTIANYFLIFAKLGVDNYGNRTIAMLQGDTKKLSKAFWNIYALQFILSCIAVFSYLIYFLFIANNNYIIVLLNLLLIISGMFDINWLYFGLENFKISTIRNIFVKLINIVLIVLFVNKTNDIWIYTLIMSGSLAISQVIMWSNIKKYVVWTRPIFKEVIKHIKPNLALFIPVIAVSIYKWMDKIMLGSLSTMVEVGFFENSEKLINIPLGFVTALGTVMLPRMSNMIANGEIKKSEKIINKSILFSIFLCCGMTFGILGVSKEFVPLFFGDGFDVINSVLFFLAPTMIFICWANVIRTQFLIPNSQDKSYIFSVISGAIINLLINLILIPKYGAVGAALGTLLAEATVCIVQTIAVKKHLKIKKYIIQCIPFLIFGSLMFFIIQNIEMSNIIFTLITKISVGGIFYLIFSFSYFVLLKRYLKK